MAASAHGPVRANRPQLGPSPLPGWSATGDVVAPVTVAASSSNGPTACWGAMSSIEGALLLQPAFVVHSFGMRFAIDVAFCDRNLGVISVITMGRNRLTRPRLRGWALVEAQGGAFARWHLGPGSHLSVESG